MNQGEKILRYMAFEGPITTYAAFMTLHVTKLSTRISELRKEGYDICDEFVTCQNLDGNHSIYKRYWLRNQKDREELRKRFKKENKA